MVLVKHRAIDNQVRIHFPALVIYRHDRNVAGTRTESVPKAVPRPGVIHQNEVRPNFADQRKKALGSSTETGSNRCREKNQRSVRRHRPP